MFSFKLYKEPDKQAETLVRPVLFFILFILIQPLSAYGDTHSDSTFTPRSDRLTRLTTLPGRAAVRFYQVLISDQDLPTCHFNPTCSSYGFEAYKSTDPFQATLMTFDRLTRCNYFIYGEYPLVGSRFLDPVRDNILWGKPVPAYPRIRPVEPISAKPRDLFIVASEPGGTQADLRFADAMVLSGETELALKEYRRLSEDTYPDGIRIEALFHSGWTLFEEARFKDAAAAFSEIKNIAPEKSAEAEDAGLLEHLAAVMCESGATPVFSYREHLHVYISAWGDIRQGKFEEACESLDKLSRSDDTVIAGASRIIQLSLDSLITPDRKKRWAAGTLSALVPGLGRIYTGRYGDAFFSFALTGGTAGLAVRALQTGPWAKAVFFNGSALAFYTANIYGSIISAETENRRNYEKIIGALEAKAKADNILPRQIISERLSHRLEFNPVPAGSELSEMQALKSRESGDKHFIKREWHKAVRAYRRFIFFSHGKASTDSVLFKLGKSLENAGESEKACVSFERILDRCPDSLLAGKTRLSLARLHFRSGEEDRARLELEDEIVFGADTETKAESEYLKSWIYSGRYDWNGAEAWIESLHDRSYPGRLAKAFRTMREELENRHIRPRKSPRLGRNLSIILPGLGQVYAGRYWNGIGAFVINSAIIYSTAHSVQSENWLDAALIAGLLFHRFYMGNIYNAEKFCHEFNESADKRLFETIRGKVRLIDPALDPYRN